MTDRLSDAVAWCSSHAATLRWGDDRRGPVVAVEILAPGSTWLVLRAEGDTLLEAVDAARDRFAAMATRPRAHA